MQCFVWPVYPGDDRREELRSFTQQFTRFRFIEERMEDDDEWKKHDVYEIDSFLLLPELDQLAGRFDCVVYMVHT